MLTQATILAAEDQEPAAMILKMAFEETGLPYRLVIVGDGQCAVDYLNGTPPYDDRAENPLPRMMLLDLKIPRMNGLEFLAWLRASEFKALPVVVLSSSPLESDIERAKELGAREYVVKPIGWPETIDILKRVAGRWMAVPDCTA